MTHYWTYHHGRAAQLRVLKEWYRLAEKADLFGRLAQRYERAAARPWLPVEPDPPEPQ
jgi:hypothetical protein